MLFGQPFTIQYAREQLPDNLRHDPNFIGVNYIITAAWAAAFAVMVAVDTAWVLVPGFSPTIVLIVSCAAIFCAFRFPYWGRHMKRARIYANGSTLAEQVGPAFPEWMVFREAPCLALQASQ